MIFKLLVSLLVASSGQPLGALAERRLNIINACPQAITVFVSGESQGSVASGATAVKMVPDDWSGFIYSNVNAPEGNTGAGATKAGFVAEARYYFVVKDSSNFNTGISVVPSDPSNNGLCKRVTCNSRVCPNSYTEQPSQFPAPSNNAPAPPLFACPSGQSFDFRFCPNGAFPRNDGTANLHPNGNTRKCLDARGGVAANGTAVQILDCSGAASQKWKLAPGETSVELAGTGFCVDAGSSPASRIPLKLWKCLPNLPAQTWVYNARSQLALKSRAQCVDLTAGNTANRNAVQTFQCSDGNSNQTTLPDMSSEGSTYTLPIYSQTANNEQTTPRTRKMNLVDLTASTSIVASEKPSTRNALPVNPPRWRTTEFYIYYSVAIVVIPIMCWIPMSVSSESHPNYPFYKTRLSPGWLFGWKMDNSDAQYRSFRGNLLYLIGGAFLYLSVKFIRRKLPLKEGSLSLMPLNAVLALVVVFGLHGASALKVLAILSLNYTIAKQCKGSKLGPALTWVFNGSVLFANELNHGYRFSALSPALEPLDNIHGIYPRWHVIFNITMLRLISFNMDFYWSHTHLERTLTNKLQNTPDDKQRQELAHPYEFYSFVNYIAYALYPPLYIAGPIMSFNDFIWQHRRPVNPNFSTVRNYLLRFLVSFFTMEFILHTMYVVAIKDRKAWVGDTPAQISMIGFWNLIIVWLKLLIPWRFFRLWAMADGILPPENMVRCMANNYSTLGFWRSWHRSYNLWVIRYIYIPLGGAKNTILNTLLVFTFVALWHDLSFRLLAWGWLISLFVVPELLANYLLPKSKYGKRAWFRHVCAIGAVGNVLMMMAANLVGFVIGTDGIKFFVSQLVGTAEGFRFLVAACLVLFLGVQLMFEYREEEARHGIYRRC